ncbi:hypothetical protein JCM1840_005125 [Sporobolomyces johnsonii]
MLPTSLALPPASDPVGSAAPTSGSHLPGAPSPTTSTASKRKHSGVEIGDMGSSKGKAKRKQVDEDDGDESDEGDGRGKKKRNRMALSCKECKCDRVMPVCGNCSKRGRPSDCSWDVFQPANDAFLPPSIARTSDLETLAARLAHVEAYLKTLPPNFALFRPYAGITSGAMGMGENGRTLISAGGPKAERDAEDGYSDTEDAAVTLENGVFNGRLALDPSTAGLPKAPYSMNTTSNASVSTSSRPFIQHAPSSYTSARPAARFGAPSLELTSALTSIVSPSLPYSASASLRAHLAIDFDASAEAVDRARKDEVERMIRSLPGREATAYLVDRYFTSVAWLFRVVHAPSFRAEVESFHKLCDQGRQNEVDVFWLSLLLMVLCLALDSTHFSRSPLALDPSRTPGTAPAAPTESTPLSMYTSEQLEGLPERWFAVAMRAMRLGEWETVPRIRSIQTIILFTQYLQLSSSSRGQPSQLVVWLAGAIRLAQVLNLHLLGSNPETMPPDDPAFPPGRNSLKREMAKRLWAVLVYQDWLGANSRNRSYLISPLHFDTDDPLNLNDSDLSPSTTSFQSAPSSVLTDSSADRVRIATARQVRKVFDHVVLAKDSSYETILELDAGFRTILDELPERWTLAADEQEAPMLRFQRHFVLEGLHNRIFRLHRPLLSKASRNPKYKFSAEACLKSARAVVVSTHNIREAVSDVPYTYSHVLGAALVLFNDLFQAIDHDLSAPEIDSKIDTLQLALEIFSSKPSSRALGLVVQQGQRILSGLFREEERRRTARAARALMLASAGGVNDGIAAEEDDETETFAEVLQRIARSLNSDSAPHRGTPPPTRNIPSKASAARFTSATFPPSAPSTLPPFDDLSLPGGPPSTSAAAGGAGSSSASLHLPDPQTWPFPRPATTVDDLSLQFFHELDVGLPNLDLGGGRGLGGDAGAGGINDFWSASQAFDFGDFGSGAGVASALEGGENGVEWQSGSGGDAAAAAAGGWSLDNLGVGDW